MQKLSRTRQLVASGALVLAGLGIGATVGTVGSASAADDSSTASTADAGKPPRPEALTGATAAKVKAAALAKYPGATVERTETARDGGYQARITTKAGDKLTVKVSTAYEVTGTVKGGDCDGPGGRGPGGPGNGETDDADSSAS